MHYRPLALNAQETRDLRAGLSLARIRWRKVLESIETDPWTHYSVESMRLSAELYRLADGGMFNVTQASASCIAAAAKACEDAPDGLGSDLSRELQRIAKKASKVIQAPAV